MKSLVTLYFFSAFLVINYAQEYPEKGKKYDVQIFDYLNGLTDHHSIDTFLLYSKPFSKWDIRPLSKDRVWIFDSVYNSGDIPNFIWGAFAYKYYVSKKDAMDFPNRFLQKGIDEKSTFIDNLQKNLPKFKELTQNIQLSNNSCFVNQNSLFRIDEIYKEDGRYWKYYIPTDSPYPMSNKIDSIINITYSEDQIQILDLLKELNIYAAFKTTKGIFYLLDGFTDNSYGFYFNREGKMETDNFLFHILASEKLNSGYFYYVAN